MSTSSSSLQPFTKRLLILGTRGVPAKHGGFETFAEHLALYLAGREWDVSVYCQREGNGAIAEESWNGVRRILVPVRRPGAIGSVLFDLKASLHSMRQPGVALVLGYNTAIFNLPLRFSNKRVLMNMDGIEWKRDKWSYLGRKWLHLNEILGSHLSHHLIADHPEIETHLQQHVSGTKITMIPYGAQAIEKADDALIATWGLAADRYALVIARPEPENSILEIVRAFSRKRRGYRLVVLGRYLPDEVPYHATVIAAASDEVDFVGAIYEPEVVQALRFFARLYVHGHTVGGTNPSLVEALGAGNAILAHDNPFNRWVAGLGARYFSDEERCARAFDRLLEDAQALEHMAIASRARHGEAFLWTTVLSRYEALLEQYLR